MKRYEITRRGEPFVGGVDNVVGTNMTWQQALLVMATADHMNIDYALASLEHSQTYPFHDENGSLCWLRERTVDDRSYGE
ncbi:hypothetical protein [Arthrobacter sp. 754]|uniref:hypothetical protein n=1 Tax=Arthrobacter sp. 754 TaxID=3156315 RepID=UPI003395DE51